jgi:hypothetical protein
MTTKSKYPTDRPADPNEKTVTEPVPDIGIGAYIMMHGFKVVGRKGKNIYFSVPESDQDEFHRLRAEYLSSPFHHFDHCIMALKKFGDYLPDSR